LGAPGLLAGVPKVMMTNKKVLKSEDRAKKVEQKDRKKLGC
jgi:hypothetical protein